MYICVLKTYLIGISINVSLGHNNHKNKFIS